MAQSGSFEERIVRLCQTYVGEILEVLGDDDMPVLVVPIQLRHEGKKPPCISLFLQDRALLLWSTGFVRMESHVGEVPYASVVDVQADGSDLLHVDAGTRWTFGGFRDTAPILRDMVEAMLRRQFRYEVGAGGAITTLEFAEIGLTLRFGDDDDVEQPQQQAQPQQAQPQQAQPQMSVEPSGPAAGVASTAAGGSDAAAVEASSQAAGSGTPAAAWHPDPRQRHQLRYWDGERWTHHVSDDGRTGIDPL